MVSGFGQKSEMLTHIPQRSMTMMKLVPLQYDPLSGAIMSQETIVRIKKVI